MNPQCFGEHQYFKGEENRGPGVKKGCPKWWEGQKTSMKGRVPKRK
jgi:hypothetical protein